MTLEEIQLRDRFAECALHGILSFPPKTKMEPAEAAKLLAVAAYAVADAMLAERKRTK